jgi:hypothetical protein
VKKEPIDDLRLLFLKLIAEETPEAATVLFSLGDVGKWMECYGVSAAWLELFLREVLEQGQEHIKWVVEYRADESESQSVEDEYMRRYRKRKQRWTPKEQGPAQAEAWLRTLKTYQSGQVMLREAAVRHPDRIAYADPNIDKRKGENHCLWLVQQRFGGMSDNDIAKDTGIDRSDIGKLRRKFARDIGLELKKRRRP